MFIEESASNIIDVLETIRTQLDPSKPSSNDNHNVFTVTEFQ
jgi:hypothetical protein